MQICRNTRQLTLAIWWCALLLAVSPAQGQRNLDHSEGQTITKQPADQTVTPPDGDRRRAGNAKDLSHEFQALAAATPLVTISSAAGADTRQRRDSDLGSGILVSPCIVLTARHVLATSVPGKGRIDAISVRFVTQTGAVTHMAKIFAVGGQPGRQRGNLLDDWALLQMIEAPASVSPMRLMPNNCCVQAGMAAAVIGYPVDRFQRSDPIPWVDPACAVAAQLIIRIVALDCQATSGNSGGPLLVKTESGWQLAGIVTRAPATAVGGALAGKRSYAIPIERFLARQIAEATANAPCMAKPIGAVPQGVT